MLQSYSNETCCRQNLLFPTINGLVCISWREKEKAFSRTGNGDMDLTYDDDGLASNK